MPTDSTRRQFAKSSAAALLASSPALWGCREDAAGQSGPSPVSGFAHAGYELEGRDRVFLPPSWGPSSRRRFDGKNVIVLMLDSFRWDHLGAFGNSKAPTPNLDQFAAESTFFTHSYPEGLPTVPVRTSLLTGRFTYPFRRWQVLYPEDHPLLPEILWSEGFRTALISDTYHLHKPSYGFSRGFDDVKWLRGQEQDPYVRDPAIIDSIDVSRWFKPRGAGQNEERETRTYLANRHDWKTDEDHFTPRIMRSAVEWLEHQPRKENLFLWIDNFCPHEPWDPPESYLKLVDPGFASWEVRNICPSPGDSDGYLDAEELRQVLALYAAVVRFVDAWVGYFLAEVKRMGMFDNTMIVVMTDHGEPFGDHGIVRKVRPWGYEELARTFLMIRDPSGGGVDRVDSYVQQTDVTATVLDWLGIDRPAHMTSESLMPLILGQQEKIRDESVCCHYNESISIRHDEWSYHWFVENSRARASDRSSIVKDAPELYNLREDPAEQNNLALQEPERVADMDRRMRAFTQELLDRERA
ncbi:MAG: sulfatase [Bryobacterales bacterium]|nr:sulfatase [Bryobacterales bacterium]MDE0621837.1 sulfatase [Bryobacterales bacterium]